MPDKNYSRYSVPSDEDFEPDSNNEVIKNYLGIKSKEIMDEIEQSELNRTELELVNLYGQDHQFKAEDICNIHELWLGDVYPMAGRYRTVNMEKNGFLFAAPSRIEGLMKLLEKDHLAKYTPCQFSGAELSYALGIIHVEFILIHPFREGNGRSARLLADLMAIQANMPPLNYLAIDQVENPKGFFQYIEAIHAGFNKDYSLIQDIFSILLQQST
jgi:cell filamentation protein